MEFFLKTLFFITGLGTAEWATSPVSAATMLSTLRRAVSVCLSVLHLLSKIVHGVQNVNPLQSHLDTTKTSTIACVYRKPVLAFAVMVGENPSWVVSACEAGAPQLLVKVCNGLLNNHYNWIRDFSATSSYCCFRYNHSRLPGASELSDRGNRSVQLTVWPQCWWLHAAWRTEATRTETYRNECGEGQRERFGPSWSHDLHFESVSYAEVAEYTDMERRMAGQLSAI